MKIRELPLKKQITYFEVQYFVNEGKQGKAKNVLAVRYSTHPNRFRAKNDESVQHREYFDLTCGREINRKTKKHFGNEMSEEIKQRIKALKTDQNITTMFGIRQVRYKSPHKTLTGKWFHKRQLDINNLVFVHVTENNEFTASFMWEGEKISVVVTPHRGALSSGQSVGVGYYTSASADTELAERVLELKNRPSAASDLYPVATDKAPLGDDATETHDAIDIQGTICNENMNCVSLSDPVQPQRITNTRNNHRKTCTQRTEYEIFQELCSTYVGHTEPPNLSLGLSFKLPSDRISTGTGTS